MTGGSSAPSFHSTVTRLLARFTRAPRTPASLREALLDRDDAGAAIDAVDDKIHRGDAVGRAADEMREVLRFRQGPLLVRSRVRHRQFVLAAEQALRPAARFDHQGPAARRAPASRSLRNRRRRRRASPGGPAPRRTDAGSAPSRSRSEIGAPSRSRNSTMTRSPGPSARVITSAFQPRCVLRARVGDPLVERLARVVGVFEFRSVQRVQREIDQGDVRDEHHPEERAEPREDVPSGQLFRHNLYLSWRSHTYACAPAPCNPSRIPMVRAPPGIMARRNDRPRRCALRSWRRWR